MKMVLLNLSHIMRKPVLSYANNKGADQPPHLRSLISAFVVRCLDNMILFFYIRNFKPLASLCGGTDRLILNWSETPKTGFLVTRLILKDRRIH